MSSLAAQTSTVPAGLTFDPATDPGRGRHLVLAMPWGARIVDEHEQAGTVLERGDVVVDRALLESGLSVNVNHDPARKIGSVVDATADSVGVWAVVDLTGEGEDVLARSDGSVSAEAIMPGFRWLLSGVALLSGSSEPAIPGSRVVFSQDSHSVYATEPTAGFPGGGTLLADMAREADVSGGVAVINRGGIKAPPPPTPRWPAMDQGAAKRFTYSMSLTAELEQAERERAHFAERQAAIAATEAKENSHQTYLESHGIMPSDARHPGHAEWRREAERRREQRRAEQERAMEETKQIRRERERREAAERGRREAEQRAGELAAELEVERRRPWRRMTRLFRTSGS